MGRKRKSTAKLEETFSSLVEKKKEELLRDYKIMDLTANDEETLMKLASALVILGEIENRISDILAQLKEDPSNRQLVLSLNDLNQAASALRTDISRFQNDLNITRKLRDKDEDEDVVSFIDKVRRAARKFSEYRTVLVFCDNCNNLIGQVWFKNPKTKGNKATFVCDKCKKSVTYSPNMHSDVVHPRNYKRVPQYI